MIKVSYFRTKHRVTVKGHAEFAEPGNDPICAAITMLVRTLAADCVHAEDDNRMRGVNIKLEPGDAEISCAPSKKLNSVITLIFDSVCTGFDILARQYPEFVAFQIL